MPEPLNWDEFRIVRAIAEAHSLGGAAERLGLNHSTLFRRLAALEGRLGLKLFERERSGYRPTPAGEDMTALAALMGDTIAEFEQRVVQKDVKPSGQVRVTTLYGFGELAMPEITAALIAAHPGLQIDLLLTDSTLNLERGEADLALRRLNGPPAATLSGRRFASLRWGVYAAESLSGGGDVGKRPWVVQAENFALPLVREWLDRHVDLWRRVASANNHLALADLAARGVGAALLPCCVARFWPELRRIGHAVPELDSEAWLLSTEASLRKPRVRAAFDFLAEELERRSAWFEGESADEPKA